ncbi:MAG: hypothetical protein AAFX99_26885, partial [Myxococcota bacterium]
MFGRVDTRQRRTSASAFGLGPMSGMSPIGQRLHQPSLLGDRLERMMTSCHLLERDRRPVGLSFQTWTCPSFHNLLGRVERLALRFSSGMGFSNTSPSALRTQDPVQFLTRNFNGFDGKPVAFA